MSLTLQKYIPLITNPNIILFFLLGLVILLSYLMMEKKEKTDPTNLLYMAHKLLQDALKTFLNRAISSILQVIVYLCLILYLFSYFFDSPFFPKQILAFCIGACITGGLAFLSLRMIPNKIPLLLKEQYQYSYKAISACFKLSFIIANLNVSLVTLGIVIIILYLGHLSLIGYLLGMVLSSFFLRIGGGLYKTSQKLALSINQEVKEKNMIEQHFNPHKLLNIAGKYVDHFTGYSIDVLSSYLFSVVSVSLFAVVQLKNNNIQESDFITFLLLPILIVVINIISSAIIFLIEKWRISKLKYNNCLLESVYISMLLTGTGTYLIFKGLKINETIQNTNLFSSYIIGLIAAILVCLLADITTSKRYNSVKFLAKKASLGSAISSLEGMMLGLRSNSIFMFILLLALLLAYHLGGFYAVTLASLGMSSMMLNIIQVTSFSAIASIGKKSSELGKIDGVRLKNIEKCNQLGKTTLSIGNGFASGLALVSALALFLTFSAQFETNIWISIDTKLISGVIIGIILAFLFSSFLLQSLITVSIKIKKEVDRQFRNIPFLKENKAKPDLKKAGDYSAALVMDALIVPAMIMVLIPLLISVLIGEKIVLGIAIGSFLITLSQSYYWSNSGEALQQADDYIKDGHFGGENSTTYTKINQSATYGAGLLMVLSPSKSIFVKVVMVIAILSIIIF